MDKRTDGRTDGRTVNYYYYGTSLFVDTLMIRSSMDLPFARE